MKTHLFFHISELKTHNKKLEEKLAKANERIIHLEDYERRLAEKKVWGLEPIKKPLYDWWGQKIQDDNEAPTDRKN